MTMSFLQNIFNYKKSTTKIYDLDNPKINIVTEHPDEGWVLRMMSEQWAEHLPNCTISSREPDKNADIKEKITINTNTIEIPDREEKVIN